VAPRVDQPMLDGLGSNVSADAKHPRVWCYRGVGCLSAALEGAQDNETDKAKSGTDARFGVPQAGFKAPAEDSLSVFGNPFSLLPVCTTGPVCTLDNAHAAHTVRPF